MNFRHYRPSILILPQIRSPLHSSQVSTWDLSIFTALLIIITKPAAHFRGTVLANPIPRNTFLFFNIQLDYTLQCLYFWRPNTSHNARRSLLRVSTIQFRWQPNGIKQQPATCSASTRFYFIHCREFNPLQSHLQSGETRHETCDSLNIPMDAVVCRYWDNEQSGGEILRVEKLPGERSTDKLTVSQKGCH